MLVSHASTNADLDRLRIALISPVWFPVPVGAGNSGAVESPYFGSRAGVCPVGWSEEVVHGAEGVLRTVDGLRSFDEQIFALYAGGMTTREIQRHLRELYGVDVVHPSARPLSVTGHPAATVR